VSPLGATSARSAVALRSSSNGTARLGPSTRRLLLHLSRSCLACRASRLRRVSPSVTRIVGVSRPFSLSGGTATAGPCRRVAESFEGHGVRRSCLSVVPSAGIVCSGRILRELGNHVAVCGAVRKPFAYVTAVVPASLREMSALSRSSTPWLWPLPGRSMGSRGRQLP